jgi:hypothetical protein
MIRAGVMEIRARVHFDNEIIIGANTAEKKHRPYFAGRLRRPGEALFAGFAKAHRRPGAMSATGFSAGRLRRPGEALLAALSKTTIYGNHKRRVLPQGTSAGRAEHCLRDCDRNPADKPLCARGQVPGGKLGVALSRCTLSLDRAANIPLTAEDKRPQENPCRSFTNSRRCAGEPANTPLPCERENQCRLNG